MNNHELDLYLKLLSGEPIEVDENVGDIKPLTIREIVRAGYTEYLRALNLMTLEVKDLVGEDPKIKELNLTVFDLLVQFGGEEISRELEFSLGLFFNDDAEIDVENNVVVIGQNKEAKFIYRDNFDRVREVIKWQNCVNKFGDNINSSSEDSDAVKKIKERLQKSREAIDKAKKQDSGDGDGIDITDIISAVSTKSSSLNKITVFDLNIFQLYDEYKRLELIEQYDLGIKSMLAGAKDVKLKHWSSKLDW